MTSRSPGSGGARHGRPALVALAVLGALALRCGCWPAPLAAQGAPPLRLGEEYGQARIRLLAQGWRPPRRRDGESCAAVLPEDRRCARFPELASCAHTGLGLCRFEWRSPDGHAYAVITREGSPSGAPGRIDRWFRID
ncbi:MAG: hypothetical protein ACKOZW_07415 [Cyanobium sp.]